MIKFNFAGYDAPRQNQVTSTSYHRDNANGRSQHNLSRNDSAIAQSPHGSPNRSLSTHEQYQSPPFMNNPGKTDRLSNEEAPNYRSVSATALLAKNLSRASSQYATVNGSSVMEDPSMHYQSPQEANRRDSRQTGVSDNEASGRASKRRQSREFLNDNQKLMESLNRLHQLNNDPNPTGSAFQYEVLSDDDAPGLTADYSHGNSFSCDNVDGNAYPLTEDARQSHGTSPDDNGREYPNMDGRSSYNNPGRPSQYKAFEKQRLDPQSGQYKEILNNTDQRFRFGGGFQKSGCKEEYV